jgi:hypothetical protein
MSVLSRTLSGESGMIGVPLASHGLAFELDDPAEECLVCQCCGRVATARSVSGPAAIGPPVVGVCRRCRTGRARQALTAAGLTFGVIWSVAAPMLAHALSHPHGIAHVLLYCHLA